MVYRAYNVMKTRGKRVGSPYLVERSKRGESKEAFKSRVKAYNYRWNKKVGKPLNTKSELNKIIGG